MGRGLIVTLMVGISVVAAASAASTPHARPALAISCGRMSDSEPVWAPGGRVLAFTRVRGSGGYSAVYRIRLDGKQLRLLSREVRYAYGAAWSPDGSKIAYSTFDLSAVVRIVVARADGTAARVLATFAWQREPPATFLSWSPDGTELAYVGSAAYPSSDLYAARVDGSGTRLLARGATQPAWSPDGRRLAYVLESGITIADADGSGARVVAEGGFPAWSPDGRRLAYGSRSGIGVRMVNADGSNDHVVDRLGSTPAWSRDGRRLVDSTQPDGSRSHVRVVDLGSGRITTVTHDLSPRFGADDFQPRFSPRGERIAFTSASMTGVPTLGGSEIRLVRPNGRNEQRLTYHCSFVDDGSAGSRIDGTWLPDLITGGPHRDRIYGYRGDDTIRARDGARDAISCGPGRDRVIADRTDSIARDCESVSFSRPRP
jgi:Tol biopolymer transport system component